VKLIPSRFFDEDERKTVSAQQRRNDWWILQEYPTSPTGNALQLKLLRMGNKRQSCIIGWLLSEAG
jgi:hypothetical protein